MHEQTRRCRRVLCNCDTARKRDYFLSAAGAAAAAASLAAASASTLPAGIDAVAIVGFDSAPCWMAVTPAGSFKSDRWIEVPTSMPDRSTSTNSGKSFGRQLMSSSDATWLMIPADSLTAGEISALTKC